MSGEYQIVYVERPEETVWEILGKGLDAYNIGQAGEYNAKRICFALKAADNVYVGGVLGEIFWNWLHIDILWVKEELRGYGYGCQLLTQIETEARKLGAKNAFLDTFSFQSPDFYKKYGYRVFGELQDFPPRYQRYFFTKQL